MTTSRIPPVTCVKCHGKFGVGNDARHILSLPFPQCWIHVRCTT
jgi:hypothetical protein